MTLTAGMLAGLGAVPLAGWWIDRGARRAPAAAALLVRAVGSLLLALVPGIAGFAIGAVLIGVGTQIAPPTNSALVAARPARPSVRRRWPRAARCATPAWAPAPCSARFWSRGGRRCSAGSRWRRRSGARSARR